MADYWVSQPRKFCEFCKCWIADNKPSRDFHEKGKKHQQNVRDKINQVAKKGVEKDKKDQEMADTLKYIERAALAALKKDVTKDPSLASQYGVKLKTKEEKDSEGKESPKDSEKEKSIETPKESQKSNNSSLETKDNPNNIWKEERTPEGYVYYWHTVTGETQWVPPDGYTPTWERGTKDQMENSSEPKAAESRNGRDSKSENSPSQESSPEPETKISVKTEKVVKKTKKPAANIQTTKLLPIAVSDIPMPKPHRSDLKPLPPKTHRSDPKPLPQKTHRFDPKPELKAVTEFKTDPETETESIGMPVSGCENHTPQDFGKVYGKWQSTQPEDPEQIDWQLPVDNRPIEVKTIPITEPKMKFREKKVDTLGAEFIAFKKRKLNAKKGNMRTTDTEKN